MHAAQQFIDSRSRISSRSALMRRFAFMVMLAGGLISGCLMDPEESFGDDEKVGIFEEGIAYGGHDYLFVTTAKTWAEAKAYCALYDINEYGGYHLVTVNSSSEEGFLDTQEIAQRFNNWWIGYSDEVFEGIWTWSTGSSSFTNWGLGQPANSAGDEDCAVDRSDGVNSWSARPCTSINPFVCERDAGAVGYAGYFSYSKSNTASATTNTAQKTIYLDQNKVFTMGTCGLPNATGSGDTFLRLMDPSGVQIAESDNAGGVCGNKSNVSIIIPATGSYVIHAGCYANTACSGKVVYNY